MSFTRDKFRRPEQLFQEFIRKGAQGVFVERGETTPFLYRALVVGIDVDGGKLENPKAEGGVSHEINGETVNVAPKGGPVNPPNSIKARVISDGHDKFTTDDNLRVFWPFFPENISVPIKVGEYVYVVFEDSQMLHGLWITKVPGHTGVNYAEGKSFFKSDDDTSLSKKFPDTKGVQSDKKPYNKTDDATESPPGNRLTSKFGGK